MGKRKETVFILFLFLFFLFLVKSVDTESSSAEEKGVQKEEKAEPAGETPCIKPKIIRLIPESGKPGDTIHIKGRRFGLDQGKVTFNGIPAEVLTWRMETIYVKVPDKTTNGPVIVNNGCDDSNSVPFKLEPISQEK
jgi:hypothetical protein